ncbi:hypothetical protein PVAP13_6NG343801 [Panicum virgatum]|uniref:Uncharacterized protein n=1 Tax=Panicum virgatum TaxID=38727 RepID=A0A8T0R4F4_PANVG|nr:hypothetical protein PVAP13_6NG343801 [Panicum virgatum]
MEVDARVEDFIQWFRKHLRLQRFDSILSYWETSSSLSSRPPVSRQLLGEPPSDDERRHDAGRPIPKARGEDDGARGAMA